MQCTHIVFVHNVQVPKHEREKKTNESDVLSFSDLTQLWRALQRGVETAMDKNCAQKCYAFKRIVHEMANADCACDRSYIIIVLLSHISRIFQICSPDIN